MILESRGAIEAAKRSGSLFKKTWGENLAAQAGFSLVQVILAIPGIALLWLGYSLADQVGATAAGVMLVVGGLWMAILLALFGALNGVFQTALYHYVKGSGVYQKYFSRQVLAKSFGRKAGAR
jgi:hypothetical protein